MSGKRLVALFLCIGTVSLSADEPVRIKLESGYYLFEPAWIRIKVQVEPDEANRGLFVTAVSDSFERSSFEQLEGTRSRRTRWVDWPDVPAGNYTVTAYVDRPGDRPWRAIDGFRVIGRE